MCRSRDLGRGAPPEARATVAADLGPVFKADRRGYITSNYSAVSLAEAVRQLLPTADLIAVAGTGVVPSMPRPMIFPSRPSSWNCAELWAGTTSKCPW